MRFWRLPRQLCFAPSASVELCGRHATVSNSLRGVPSGPFRHPNTFVPLHPEFRNRVAIRGSKVVKRLGDDERNRRPHLSAIIAPSYCSTSFPITLLACRPSFPTHTVLPATRYSPGWASSILSYRCRVLNQACTTCLKQAVENKTCYRCRQLRAISNSSCFASRLISPLDCTERHTAVPMDTDRKQTTHPPFLSTSISRPTSKSNGVG